MHYLGLDPGANGAAVLLCDAGQVADQFTFKGKTEHDIAEWVCALPPCSAALELVHSTPQMGCVSAFTFGRGYGFLRGLLCAAKIPFQGVRPLKWQNGLACRTKGDKNVTKAKAQQLWPKEKWTHANADAALIAEWLRRNHD